MNELDNSNTIDQIFKEFEKILNDGVSSILYEKDLGVIDYIEDILERIDGFKLSSLEAEKLQELLEEINMCLDLFQFEDLMEDTIIGIYTVKKKTTTGEFLVCVSYTSQSVDGSVYVPTVSLIEINEV